MTTDLSKGPGIVQALLTLCPDPIFGVTLDGTVAYANPVAARRFSEGALGRPFGEWVDGDAAEFAELTSIPWPDGPDGARTLIVLRARGARHEDWSGGRRPPSGEEPPVEGGIVHDFTNLLMIIIGHCELILEEKNPEVARAQVETILERAWEARHLTQRLFALDQVHRVPEKLHDPWDSLATSVESLAPLLGPEVELVLEAASDLPPVAIDALDLDRVVTNLVLNARDAITGPGLVRVSLSEHARDGRRCVELVVSDNGEGMDEATLAQVFEPFFSNRPGGRGIGLAVAARLIRDAGGTISAESEEGVGSLFQARLPCPVGAPSRRLLGDQCLVVTGDPLLGALLDTMLRPRFRTLEVRANTDGLVPGEFHGSVALLDLDQGMSDYTVGTFHQRAGSGPLPVVLLGTPGKLATFLAAHPEQRIATVEKPVDATSLFETLESFLDPRPGSGENTP